MSQRWRLREPDPDAVRALSRAKDLPPVLATLLVSRGHRDADAAERHLLASPMSLHDPFLFPGLRRATERIARAVRERETILVHGDYDVDGVTGTALLMRLFAELGARAEWHIPNRLKDGYSFGAHSVERAEACGARVVISVDNGTSAHAVIAELARRGIDTIVTDHHEPPDGPLPEALAIVNPKLRDSTYPWRELCGGAVAFKLAWGIAQEISGGRRASEPLRVFLEEATALVAIATIADVVPLVDENRVFARFGLKALAQSRSPGLRALLEVSGIAGRPLSAEDVAFQIAPRINASGRLGSAEEAVRCLLATDAESARTHANALDAMNRERKEIEAAVLAEARVAARVDAERDEPMLVLAGAGWHQGVVGIVAARLVEEFRRPAVVIGLDGNIGRGSARTTAGFDVLAALAGGAAHLERFGGHRQAAGLEVRAECVGDARAAILGRARELLAGTRTGESDLWIDCELPFPEMNSTTMRQLDRMTPFGAENEKPLFLSRRVWLAEVPRRIGSTSDHLLLSLRQGQHVLKALGFRMGARFSELALGTPLDAVYTPRWRTFRGETALELELADFRPAVS
jgi:single-stranded-DNA-specific exonuclease